MIGNGGLIGPRNLPTRAAASGVWRLREVQQAMQSSAWPLLPVVATHTANDLNNSGLSSYTFTAKSIGTAAVGRRVVVAAGTPAAGSAQTITGVTCGGVAMTKLVDQSSSGGGGFPYGSLWILQVDAGTTADIVVTASGSLERCGIGVWAVYNLASSTPTDTLQASTSDPHTGAIDCDVGGCIIAAAFDFSGTAGNNEAWTNVTERYDQQFSATNLVHSGASDVFATAQVNLSITANPATMTAGVMIAAALR